MSVLEHLEMKVIAGGTSGVTFEAKGLTDGNRRTVRSNKSLEVSVQIRSCTGVEDAVRTEPTGATKRIEASDGTALSAVKDPVRDRDHKRLWRADDVDAGMRMLPWRIAISLAHIQSWTVHRGPDDDVGQRAAR
jgi:hypothetical protein